MGATMSDEGYNYEIVGDTFDDFFCQICSKLMKDAVQLECGHGMCDGCLKRIISQAEKGPDDLTCAKCSKEITKEKVFPATMINQVIQCVKVKCENNKRGCTWIGSISEINDHLQNTCDYSIIECMHEKCDEKMERLKLTSEHIGTCKFRPVICEHCQSMNPYTEAEAHLENCDMLPVSCPNKCTDELIPSMQMKDHLETCIFEETHCLFASVGCETKAQRLDLDEHVDESIENHVKLLMKDHIKMQSSLNNLQEDNEDLRKQLTDLRQNQDVIELKQDLAETKAELKELKLSETKKTEHAFVWVENKIVERFDVLVNNIRSSVDLCVQNCKSQIDINIVEFDEGACLLKEGLESLSGNIDKIIQQAVRELEITCMPLKDLDKVLSSLLLEIENEIPLDEGFWTEFGAERWEELLRKISVNNKVDVNNAKKQLHQIRTSLIYCQRFQAMLKFLDKKKVYTDGNFVCVVSRLNEVTSHQNYNIIMKQSSGFLVIEGILDKTCLVKLHNQLRCEEIITISEDQHYRFDVPVSELVKSGFIVEECIVITFNCSAAHRKSTPVVTASSPAESDAPRENVLNLTESNTVAYRTKLQHMDESLKPMLKLIPRTSDGLQRNTRLNDEEFVSGAESKTNKKLTEKEIKAQLTEEIRVSVKYNDVKRMLRDEIERTKIQLQKTVRDFDKTPSIITGGYSKMVDTFNKHRKTLTNKLNIIREPTLCTNLEKVFNDKVKSYTSIKERKAVRKSICNNISSEIDHIIHGVTGLGSMLSYRERFRGFMQSKLNADVYRNLENSYFVLKCSSEKSKTNYNRLSITVEPNLISIVGIESVKLDNKKASCVMLCNQLKESDLAAKQLKDTYIFTCDINELKRNGFIDNNSFVLKIF